MQSLEHLLKKNKAWAKKTSIENPQFFSKLAKAQNPEYLWIGCSDSRVPANQILDLLPGEIFVHRNVANIIVHSDLNFLSVLQYAVEVLKVKHILICGHYNCGGVHAAVDNAAYGLVENWLRHIQDIQQKHQPLIDEVLKHHPNTNHYNLMCELNVIEQAINIAKTTIIQDAWKKDQSVTIHGVLYSLTDGILKQLGPGINNKEKIDVFYKHALDEVQNII
ncbi:carbonate dehydratase [Thiotrichales bacterium 19S11-10]|nr:carbonate dehydratase [Thiotrichales bacterium 19S11-10]MCF6808081.1 carbonate dehydratase [Thiotrichales bacterium 19S9-11]MCF6812096.1 carbonate dehydratase [Thiotrichales bacterium 19S9-12]